MKLKKIASLMLAGIMAVSMLAACGSTTPNTDPTEPETPVDSSFATAVNAELNDKQKAIVTFENDATLSNALKAVADKFDSNTVNKNTTDWASGQVVTDFRVMLDCTDTDGISSDWENRTSNRTAADIIIVPGKYTEDGLAKEVAKFLGDKAVKQSVMKNGYNATATGKFYEYEYTGDIAVEAVVSLSGEVSAYIVGVVVNQTVTELAA